MAVTATPPNVSEILVHALSDPRNFIVILIQFFLGLALGYISIRAIKYVLAFIAILILGSFLSVWSLGTSTVEVFKSISDIIEVAKNFAVVLGLLTVGPISIGFVIGAIVALVKR
ncbi:MAG: hypothetical protein N3E36_07365 [Sulfolobales archaeon]|nr:hypothetical protein [Ignisphaera sp.]MCX8199810.1 hypothetical protein [Sulfolobales archaeon]MDW8084949.1 hypothetical protein [Ignisphaera sp.]